MAMTMAGHDQDRNELITISMTSANEQQYSSQRQERYRQTASSLAETLEVGRATATQLSHQGDQLKNAETMAHQTEYLLDKSARVLRGMSSWGGWLHNLVAKDVQFQNGCHNDGVGDGAIGDVNVNVNSLVERLCPVEQYLKDTAMELVPEASSRDAVEAVQNYHIHVLLLHDHCRTKPEYGSCLEACSKLQILSQQALHTLRQDTLHKYGTLPPQIGTVTSFLAKNVTLLNRIHAHYQHKWCPQKQQQPPLLNIENHPGRSGSSTINNGVSSDSRELEFLGSTRYTTGTGLDPNRNDASASSTAGSQSLQAIQQQEAHLESLMPQLHELTQLSTSIHTSLQEQSELTDKLNSHTSHLTDKTNHVKRRTHAMIQKNAWSSGTSTKHYSLDMVVTIQHLPSQKYLSVMGPTSTNDATKNGNNKDTNTDPSTIVFTDQDQRDASAWLIYKDTRHSSDGDHGDKWSLVGLQNALTYMYLGVNTAWFSGVKHGVVCHANALHTSEQWELEIVEDRDNKDRNTKNGTSKQAASWTVRMLHVSANSGNGGYMYMAGDVSSLSSSSSPPSPMIGQEALTHKNTASLWKITQIP